MKFSYVSSIATVVCAVNAIPLPFNLQRLFTRADSDDVVLSFNSTSSSNSTLNSTSLTNSTSSGETPLSLKLYSFSDEFTSIYLGSNSSNTSYVRLSESEILEILGFSSEEKSFTLGVSFESILNKTGFANTTIDYEQIGESYNETTLLDLYEAVAEAQSEYDGVVVVLDAADIEAAAFFIEVIELEIEVPIVFTTPLTLSTLADGFTNLYDALLLASDASYIASDSGVLIVSEKLIIPALYAERSTSETTDSIVSSQATLGRIYEGEIQWYFEDPQLPVVGGNFTLESNSSLPEVVVLDNSAGFSADLLGTIAGADVGGLVLSASSISDFSSDFLYEVGSIADELPIVFASSSGGSVSPDDLDTNSTIAGGFLSPVKAKVLLQAALGSGFSTSEIKDEFSSVYGG